MNKSMLMGVALGVGFATAGGVAGYQFLGKTPAADEQGSAVVEETAPEAHDAHAAPVAPAAQPAPAARPAAAAAPQPAQAAAREECYEETVTAEPRDKQRIAGTAIGAIVGGAIGKDVGDSDLTTAVGAAAGAFAGRKIQERIQERNTTATTEVRCVPVE